MRLGLLALGMKDTTSALSELALASELAPVEPHIRYVHGYVLLATGRFAEATKELTKAIELEPYYALPYLRLAQSYEQLGKGKEAVDAYQNFLAKANARHPEREYAKERLTEVKEILSVPAAKP